jgi:hypothetical protein
MQTAQGRLAAMGRAAAFVAVALTLAAPASAQFGGLKKKVKAAAGAETGAPAAPSAPAPAPTATAGTVVLTDEVVAQLIDGWNAAAAEREAAKSADTPYGRYHKASAAYASAKEKCSAAMASFSTRMIADEKIGARYEAINKKSSAAVEKGDTAGIRIYNDSLMALMDPSCLVKEPKQPDSYYEDQRKLDAAVEETAVKKSKLSNSEYAQVMERVNMALRDVPGDLSQSEKDAVAKRSNELKKLLGYEVPAARAEKPAPAPAPAPAAPAAPAMTKEQTDQTACMAENSKKNEKEIIALGERIKAAQEAGDMNAVMAMADTLARLQSGNCR